MVRGILLGSLLVSTLLFNGCSSDSEGEDRLETQQMLDDGDYTGVISKLESKEDKSSEDQMKLGSAFMGAAGLSLVDVSNMLADDENNRALRSLRNDSDSDYGDFLEKLKENARNNPKVFEFLEKAIESFKNADDSTNARLFTALSQTTRSSTGISYLGNVAQWLENGVDTEFSVSACAIKEIYGSSVISYPTAKCKAVEVLDDLDESDAYKNLLVTLPSGEKFQRLITSDMQDIVLTDGYYSMNDGVMVQTTDSGNGLNPAYPIYDERLVVADTITSALNEGFDSLLEIAPEDMIDDITEFRRELDVDGNGVISAEELAAFIEE